MKDLAFRALLSLFVVAVGTTQVAAHEEESPRLITVNGEAEIKVTPDEVIVTFGVESLAAKLEAAKTANDEIVARALEVARKHGIDDKHVQTGYFQVETDYDHTSGAGYVLEGYWVRRNVVVTLRDLSHFEGLVSDMLEAGVNYVHGVDFRTTELRKHRDRARSLAIQAAREKAVMLAGELEQRIGRPHSISEGHAGWWSWYGRWWGSSWRGRMSQNVIQEVAGGTGGGTLAPGQIAITANVTVAFELADALPQTE
ncbi:MAG: SIMPL domain-containing protein [Phycisphaerales bacterium]|nr:MAG: SIMPL domain-containing protein [Phycisphaerales bacterium]